VENFYSYLLIRRPFLEAQDVDLKVFLGNIAEFLHSWDGTPESFFSMLLSNVSVVEVGFYSGRFEKESNQSASKRTGSPRPFSPRPSQRAGEGTEEIPSSLGPPPSQRVGEESRGRERGVEKRGMEEESPGSSRIFPQKNLIVIDLFAGTYSGARMVALVNTYAESAVRFVAYAAVENQLALWKKDPTPEVLEVDDSCFSNLLGDVLDPHVQGKLLCFLENVFRAFKDGGQRIDGVLVFAGPPCNKYSQYQNNMKKIIARDIDGFKQSQFQSDRNVLSTLGLFQAIRALWTNFFGWEGDFGNFCKRFFFDIPGSPSEHSEEGSPSLDCFSPSVVSPDFSRTSSKKSSRRNRKILPIAERQRLERLFEKKKEIPPCPKGDGRALIMENPYGLDELVIELPSPQTTLLGTTLLGTTLPGTPLLREERSSLFREVKLPLSLRKRPFLQPYLDENGGFLRIVPVNWCAHGNVVHPWKKTAIFTTLQNFQESMCGCFEVMEKVNGRFSNKASVDRMRSSRERASWPDLFALRVYFDFVESFLSEEDDKFV